MGREYARNMCLNRTPVKDATKTVKDAPKSDKVGVNQKEVGVQAELSGEEEEGGTMIKVMEGIKDGGGMEVR